MNGKKKKKKKAFDQPTKSNFGILFDVYNNLLRYQQNCYATFAYVSIKNWMDHVSSPFSAVT